LNFGALDGVLPFPVGAPIVCSMPPLKPLVLRLLTPEEREARERALKEVRAAAKAAAKNGAKVGPLKKKKK
jgi:hypothetical protein